MPDEMPNPPKPPPNHDAALWELTSRMAAIQSIQEGTASMVEANLKRQEAEAQAQAYREKRMIGAMEMLAQKVENVGTRFQLIFLLVVVGGVATFLLVKGLLHVNYFMGLMVMMLTPFFGEGAVKIIKPYYSSKDKPAISPDGP